MDPCLSARNWTVLNRFSDQQPCQSFSIAPSSDLTDSYLKSVIWELSCSVAVHLHIQLSSSPSNFRDKAELTCRNGSNASGIISSAMPVIEDNFKLSI